VWGLVGVEQGDVGDLPLSRPVENAIEKADENLLLILIAKRPFERVVIGNKIFTYNDLRNIPPILFRFDCR